MNSAVSFFLSAFVSQLGRCMTCMHAAFLCFSGCLVVTIGLGVFVESLAVVYAATALTLALFLLWCAHVWVFTIRAIRATPYRDKPTEVPYFLGPRYKSEIWTRRKILASAMNVMAYSAALSTFPMSFAARANCNCYTDNDCNCPSAFPRCYFNPGTGEGFCCGSNAHGCAGPTRSWCCSNGYDCSGTEGRCR